MTTPPPADLVLVNARVLSPDTAAPVAEAVAVAGDRIRAVGTAAEISAWVGTRTTVIDLAGATVLPGLIDSHAHFARVGYLTTSSALLYDCRSIAEVIDRLCCQRDRIADGATVRGHGDRLHVEHFAEKRPLRAADLDRVATDRPVVVTDVNTMVVNGFVLQHHVDLGSLRDPEALPRERRSGLPLGVFPDATQTAVRIPATPPELNVSGALQAAAGEFARWGVTTVADAGPPLECLQAACRMSAKRELETRLVILPPLSVVDSHTADTELAFAARGPLHSIGPAKQFYDRFVMHRSALMYHPYRGEPGNVGTTFVPLAELRARTERICQRGWPTAVHVTGDRGLVEAARTLVELYGSHAAGRNHLIHGYFPTECAVETLARARIGVAVQPGFLRPWATTLMAVLGQRRASGFIPLRTYLGAGVNVAGGSDAPVTHWNPFRGMATAMDRLSLTGRRLGAAQALTFREALSLYTTAAAELFGLGDQLGSVTPGKLADLTVVDRAVDRCGPRALAETQVLITVVGGRIAFRRGGPVS